MKHLRYVINMYATEVLHTAVSGHCICFSSFDQVVVRRVFRL